MTSPGAGFENTLVFAANADFSGAANPDLANGLQTNGQLWIGTTAVNAGGTHVNRGTITSPLGTLVIGYSSPNITIDLAGGSLGVDSIGVDTTSGAGTNPVLPTPSGLITVNGAKVAAGTNPIRSVSTAPNVYQIQVQTSQAIAATDATKIGLCNFDSAKFTVDANGFVSTSGTGIAQTITGDSGGALSPTAGNFNILGLSGSKTSGSGSTLTVKSPPYADSTAATLTVNSGTFATAAGAYTLPAAPAVGDLVEVICITTGIVVTANTGQTIQLGNTASTVAGTATNTAKGDKVSLRYRATDTTWYGEYVGIWTLA